MAGPSGGCILCLSAPRVLSKTPFVFQNAGPAFQKGSPGFQNAGSLISLIKRPFGSMGVTLSAAPGGRASKPAFWKEEPPGYGGVEGESRHKEPVVPRTAPKRQALTDAPSERTQEENALPPQGRSK
jgi:hypothetical protein